MPIDEISDLTVKDVRFLMAVRDINENPEEYEGTDPGVAAANTTSLRNATSLSKGEIRHRLNEKSDIAADELGVVTLYDAPMTDQGYGPKSVELSQNGERFLEHALAARGIGDRDPADVATADRISSLEMRIEELEDTLDLYRKMTRSHLFKDEDASPEHEILLRSHDLLFQSLVGEPGRAYEDENITKDRLAKKVLRRLHKVAEEG